MLIKRFVESTCLVPMIRIWYGNCYVFLCQIGPDWDLYLCSCDGVDQVVLSCDGCFGRSLRHSAAIITQNCTVMSLYNMLCE